MYRPDALVNVNLKASVYSSLGKLAVLTHRPAVILLAINGNLLLELNIAKLKQTVFVLLDKCFQNLAFNQDATRTYGVNLVEWGIIPKLFNRIIESE